MIIDDLPGCIEIGNQDEKGAGITPVLFDVSVWAAVFPDADYSITYIRPGEISVSPELGSAVNKTVEGDVTTVIWTPSNAVTNVAGHGSVILRCVSGGDEKRSAMTAYYVAPGHSASGEAPEPVADWIVEANETLDALKAVAFVINSNGELEVNI